MWSPPKFMTLEVAERVIGEFAWPVPYTVEDDDPDGMWMEFPSGTGFLFSETFDGVDLFFGGDTNTNGGLSLGHAMHALRANPDYVLPPEPEIPYANTLLLGHTLAMVEADLRNLCTLALAYLPPYMRGDRYWIDAYHHYILGERPIASKQIVMLQRTEDTNLIEDQMADRTRESAAEVRDAIASGRQRYFVRDGIDAVPVRVEDGQLRTRTDASGKDALARLPGNPR